MRESADGIVIIDARGTIVEWNEGEERLTGVPRSDAIGQAIWDVQSRVVPEPLRGPEFVRVAREKALRGLAEGAALRRTLDEEIQRPDGSRRAVQSVLFGFRCGAALFAAGISRDVTGARQAAQALREQQALLLEAERLVRLGHWTRHARGGESTWSDGIFEILGVKRGAVTPGREAFLASVVPEDRTRVADAVSGAAADGRARRLEFRVRRPDGALRHVQATVELLCEPDGTPARLVGTAQDVTERVRLEEALAAASRNKDEFLAVLSHELRNPLSSILNGLHVLERAEPGGSQALSMLAIVERQAAHAARIVDDLLDVSRIERGKIRLRREWIDLVELVRRTVEDLRPAITAGDLHLEARIAATEMWIRADATRITQVLANLLTNAAKFTPRGGQVEVALEREGGDGVLTVTDTGAGISQEILDRVFEPFTQAHGTLDRARGGLGLGLALVKRFAELHGGSARVESGGPGRGARFSVRLPVQEGRPGAAPRHEAPRVAPCRVLVVDDDADVAATLAEVLRLDGHEVEVARDGPDGLARARAFVPDVILCDVALAGMDGYEVARAIREDEALSGVYLVALSGHALPEDVRRAKRAGFKRHLAKPASLEAIAEVLAEAARRRPSPPGGGC